MEVVAEVCLPHSSSNISQLGLCHVAHCSYIAVNGFFHDVFQARVAEITQLGLFFQ